MKHAKSLTNKHTLLIILGVLIILIDGIIWYAHTGTRSVLLFTALLMALYTIVASFFSFTIKNRERTLEIAFIIALVASGLLMNYIISPGNAPDEITHYLWSYQLSDFLTGKESAAYLGAVSDQGRICIRSCDADLLEQVLRPHEISYQSQTAALQNLFASADTTETFIYDNQYSLISDPFYTHLLSALGITLGRLFGFNAYLTFFLGRFFNFAGYAVLTVMAVRKIPTGKSLIIATALMPLALQQAFSYSYDAIILGLAFLLIALCVRAIRSEEKMSKKEIVWIAITAALLSPCKGVYIAIALSLFAVPSKRFSSRKASLIFKFGIVGLCVLMILLTKMAMLFTMAGVSTSTDSGISYRLGEAGYFYTLSDLICHPRTTIKLLANTCVSLGDFNCYTSLLSGSMGWLSIGMPSFFCGAYLLILAFSTLKSNQSVADFSVKTRVLFVFIYIAIIAMVTLSMTLSWTFTSEDVIQGVQGRYFLPAIPLLFLGLRSAKIYWDTDVEKSTLLIILFVNALYLMRLFSVTHI